MRSFILSCHWPRYECTGEIAPSLYSRALQTDINVQSDAKRTMNACRKERKQMELVLLMAYLPVKLYKE